MGSPSEASSNDSPPEDWMAVVAEQVKATRFGVVQIVIHDSKVVQIDHTERTRFRGPGAEKGQ
ncbi:MAG: YezD family protein [Chthoniobacteraceae bacterium]